MSKLDGVLQIIEWFYNGNWRVNVELMLAERGRVFNIVSLRREGSLARLSGGPWSLQETAEWLERTFRFIGHFTAYEIVTDLRHTDLLCNAPDVMTWANPGPGATRGLNYLHGRDTGKTPPKQQLVDEMRELLEMSQNDNYWPLNAIAMDKWPAWELREVEHWICEMYKYWRAKNGGAKPRGRFRHG